MTIGRAPLKRLRNTEKDRRMGAGALKPGVVADVRRLRVGGHGDNGTYLKMSRPHANKRFVPNAIVGDKINSMRCSHDAYHSGSVML